MAGISLAYEAAHQRRPHFWLPRRYTEKMQWRKLFDLNPNFAMLSDKLAVREFIESRVGVEYLVPLRWSGMPTAIPFELLEPPYVVKSTHASGHVIIVKPGEQIDTSDIREQAAAWLKICHGTRFHEPGYVGVPRRIIVEKMLAGATGGPPDEVRLFVFDGKVRVVNTVIVEAGILRNGAFHTPDWKRLGWYFSRWIDRPFPPPQRLGDMIRIAENIGAGFDHVRVDIYDCGAQIHVGEVTLYSWSGNARFTPDEADFALGAHWRLRRPLWRAGLAVLFRRRP